MPSNCQLNTAALRGSESEHIEFLQLAKGKDTGFLQVAVFESKISGGSAIAFTSRDQFRLAECMDFFRLASYFHTGCGESIESIILLLKVELQLPASIIQKMSIVSVP